MSEYSRYLYDNAQRHADKRLAALEAIEDENTISLLRNITDLEGRACLEIGAGAGSIAEWLAQQVGPAGTVTATDIEPKHLTGIAFEVLQHDIESDELPADHFDLVHIRHVLIHLGDPLGALQRIFSAMKEGAVILVEESDLSTWEPEPATPEEMRAMFRGGVEAILQTYELHGMDIQIGSKLEGLLTDAGYYVTGRSKRKRSVIGGSAEARYQSRSADQLAGSMANDNKRARSIRYLADCLLSPELRYQSRTTVSVSAERRA